MVTCLYLLNRATDKTLSVRLSVGPNPRGLARTVYVRCIYSPLGREIAKCTVMYGIYILLQPTLAIPVHNCFVVTCLYLLNRDKDSTLAHQRFVRPHMLSPVLHPHMLYFTSAAPTHAFTSAGTTHAFFCCSAGTTHALLQCCTQVKRQQDRCVCACVCACVCVCVCVYAHARLPDQNTVTAKYKAQHIN